MAEVVGPGPGIPDANTWGVTVEQVLARVPHLDVDRVTRNGDDVWHEGHMSVSRADVDQFIRDVSSRINARIAGWDTVTGGTLRTVVNFAGPALVVAGAASMTIQAAFPGSRQADDYWDQYQKDLDTLVEMVKEALARSTEGGGTGGDTPVVEAPAGSPIYAGTYLPTSLYARW